MKLVAVCARRRHGECLHEIEVPPRWMQHGVHVDDFVVPEVEVVAPGAQPVVFVDKRSRSVGKTSSARIGAQRRELARGGEDIGRYRSRAVQREWVPSVGDRVSVAVRVLRVESVPDFVQIRQAVAVAVHLFQFDCVGHAFIGDDEVAHSVQQFIGLRTVVEAKQLSDVVEAFRICQQFLKFPRRDPKQVGHVDSLSVRYGIVRRQYPRVGERFG